VEQGEEEVTNESLRTAAVAHDAFLVAHGPKSIGYVFGGGLDMLDDSMTGMEKAFSAGKIWTPDCARACCWVAKWAGWKPFGEFGFEASSGEIWQTLLHFENIEDVQAGTYITYGVGGEVHITQVMQPDGDNPWLMSHGEEFSENHVRYQVETAYHEARGAYPTLCSVDSLIS
jgi:hypothetical protein